MVVRVQTDGEITPQDAFSSSLTDLVSEVCLLEERYKAALRDKRDQLNNWEHVFNDIYLNGF